VSRLEVRPVLGADRPPEEGERPTSAHPVGLGRARASRRGAADGKAGREVVAPCRIGRRIALSLAERHNAHIGGRGERAMVFAHGFGCDQNMWRYVAPAFEDRFRTVLFDHIGAGGSDRAAYDPEKYASLDGYADDVVALCRELEVSGGVYVGHSVSAMIGILAAKKAPDLFGKLVLVGPSPCYVDDGDYVGGFSRAQIDELLDFLDSNHMGWSQAMAPVIMGNADRPDLGEELTNSFCRTDPEIAKAFARATFLSDNRADLADVQARVLILQCSNDVIAPQAVGEFVHRRLPGSELVLMEATGHCPNLSAPDETIAAIRAFA
jgi:sigma-B regulation protein RsbQ